jgi:hypothetical protein
MNGDDAAADGAVYPMLHIKNRATVYGSGGELIARRRTAFDPKRALSLRGLNGSCCPITALAVGSRGTEKGSFAWS